MTLTPATPTELARWLRERRNEAGLTQEKAATALTTSVRNIKRWEGGTDPGTLQFLRLAALYGVRIEPPPEGYRPADVASVIEAVVAELADLRSTILAALSPPAGEDPPPADSGGAPSRAVEPR